MNAKNTTGTGRLTAAVDPTNPPVRIGPRLLAVVLAMGLATASMATCATQVEGTDAHGTGKSGGSYYQIDVAHLRVLVHHVLAKASPEQKEKVVAIARSAEHDLNAMDQAAVAAGRQKFNLLLQDTVNHVAFRQAQINEMQAAAQLSKTIDRVLTEVLEIMTPEQRAALREEVKAYRG